jgi:hypothetical protein
VNSFPPDEAIAAAVLLLIGAFMLVWLAEFLRQ